ncbi:MAG TPA: mechanosensitive ion channel family protein [Bryobacteraceae bacterium]|nr:mechanosensitive ion channel family protein [Bryobacteraceae bacterium]
MYSLLPWIALFLLAGATALWKVVPRSHGRFRSALFFLGLWLVVWGGTGVASALHLNAGAARQVSIALVGLAAVQVIAGAIFDLIIERTQIPRFVAEMVVVASYIAIVVNLFYNEGFNVTGIFATSAVATAVIGLALQDMMGNIASGIALEFESDIRVGDFIRVGEGASGWVRHKRLRHTIIETPDGDRILLPNSSLTRSAVTVIPPKRRHFVPFNMPYSINPQEVIDAVIYALRGSPIPDVADEPPPSCVIQELTAGHVRYAAVVWTMRPGHDSKAVSAVLNRLYFALDRAGIPVSEITNLLEMKAAAEGANAASNPVDILRRTPIFRLLDDPGLFELGACMRHLSFAPGELIIRQGDDGDSMYFVTSGQVAINYVGAGRAELQVAIITSGDFFGETSLLTGAIRNANAIAITRVDCFELDKAGLRDIVAARPDLAEDMSVVMAHRHMELEVTREKLDLETARQREAESQMQLLARIRRFFSLKNTAGV